MIRFALHLCPSFGVHLPLERTSQVNQTALQKRTSLHFVSIADFLPFPQWPFSHLLLSRHLFSKLQLSG